MLIVRADAGPVIGAGHMMRCLTIARAYASDYATAYAGTHPSPIDELYNNEAPPNITDSIPVCFICADEEGARLPKEAGFPVHVLHTNPEDMKNELPLLLPVLNEFTNKTAKQIPSESASSASRDTEVNLLNPSGETTLLVDSYRVTDDYLSALSKIVPVFYMDDFGEHAYPVHGIINYNFYADKAAYEKLYPDLLTPASSDLSAGLTKAAPPASNQDTLSYSGLSAQNTHPSARCIALLGPTYAPIREDFSTVSYTVSEKVRNVLVLCGGGGDGSLPLRIYETLSKECDPDITWHIVLGKYAAENLPADSPLRRAISKTASHQTNTQAVSSGPDNCNEKARLFCHTDVKDMATLMGSCDLCITAGGSTVYELCTVGLPFVTFSMADNQNENCRYLDTHDIADFAGSMETEPETTLAKLSKNIQRLSSDYSLRQEKSLRQKTLIDGKGANRIAEHLKHSL